MLPFTPLAGGLLLGWSLGANDAANVFGAAVASRIIAFKKACLLCGLAIILGAVIQGHAGINTLAALSGQTMGTLLITSVAASVTLVIMTFFRLPVSASQAIVGAIVGIGLATGYMRWDVLGKVVVCWIATPIGAMLIACVVYKLLSIFLRYVPMGMLTRDKFLKAFHAEGMPGWAGTKLPINKEGYVEHALQSRGYQRIYGKAFLDRYRRMQECPVSEELCNSIVQIQQHYLLGPRSDMEQMAEAIHKIYAAAETIS